MKNAINFYVIITVLIGAALACNANAPRPTADLASIVAQTETAIAVSALLTPATGGQTPGPSGATPAAPSQTTPSPAAATPAACTNRAKFISETIPDATQFAPGAQFMKTWVLQNVGTCTWTPEYSISFVRGEQMGGTSPAPIGQTVAPNGNIQLFLPQTAPNTAGEHQGFWMLRDLGGANFGLGEDGATPFWVKINVVPGLPTTSPAPVNSSNLGPPTTTITFSGNKAPFYLGEDEDISFKVDNNALILTANKPSGDLWRVAELGAQENFAIEARFRTGSTCSRKDDYGLLVRAPSKANGVLDSGYVFSFNCDGQYRVYRMDNGAYTGLQNWSGHPSIKAGANQENAMTVIANKERMQIFANGTMLLEFYDASYLSGFWGLMIGSGGTSNFQVSVSQISIWDLP